MRSFFGTETCVSYQALNASNVPCFHVVCCWCQAPWAPWASSGRLFMVMKTAFRGKKLWLYFWHVFSFWGGGLMPNVWWMEGQKCCFVPGKYVIWIWKGEIRFALRNLGSCPRAPSAVKCIGPLISYGHPEGKPYMMRGFKLESSFLSTVGFWRFSCFFLDKEANVATTLF